MASTYQTVVEATDACGGDVVMYRFALPEGYQFRAGQWFRLTLQTAEGPETKTFSHCSAPSDGTIELTTRLSGSAFKAALGRLAPGDEVTVSGPGGRLRIPDGASRITFLVGGVGVTPVRSLLRDAVSGNRVFDDALLVYGNRAPDCAPYLQEFEGMASIGVRVVEVYERLETGQHGERGFITAELVRRLQDPSDGRPFMVAGPPVMVSAMERVLDDLGVADDRRIVEWFGRPE